VAPPPQSRWSGRRRCFFHTRSKQLGCFASLHYPPTRATFVSRLAQLGPFSLGGAGVLEDVFRQAGFGNPEVRAVAVPLRMASAAEYVRVAREAFGAFNAMMAHLPPEERDSVWNEVEGSSAVTK